MRAWLTNDDGDLTGAADLAERYLRHLPQDNLTERATGLEAIIGTKVAGENFAGRLLRRLSARDSLTIMHTPEWRERRA